MRLLLGRLIREPLVQALLGLLLLVACMVDVRFMEVAVGSSNGNDFGRFFYATQSWLTGGALYAPSAATPLRIGDTPIDLLDLNPPHFHLLLWPLATWPLAAAAVFWYALNVAAAVLALAIAWRELQLPHRRTLILPVALALLGSAVAETSFATGQVTGLLMLPITLAWVAARHDRWGIAGAWLGLVVGTKPFLALFLPVLLWAGRPRAVFAALLTVCLSFGVGLLVFGWSAHREWIHALRAVGWSAAAMNASWRGPLERAFGNSLYFTSVLPLAWLVLPLWLLGAAGFAVMTVIVGRRSVDHAFAASILGALLVSPLGWVYYVGLAAPPCIGLWHDRVPRVAVAGLVGLFCPLFLVIAWQPSALATLTIGSIYAWSTLALWFGVVSCRVSDRVS